jgi:hypothetical protein
MHCRQHRKNVQPNKALKVERKGQNSIRVRVLSWRKTVFWYDEMSFTSDIRKERELQP